MQQKQMKMTFAILAMTVMLVTATAMPAQSGKTTRVRFARGRTSAVLKDSVVRGTRDRYKLGARAGQTLIVHISSLENNASFAIYGPGHSEPIDGAEDIMDWEGTLSHSGDWIVEVGPTRGNATYTLEVTIR